jgi:Tol biopolymer transport system component
LLRMDLDGSNSKSLSDDALFSDCSPDGKWVVFSSNDHKMMRVPIEGGVSVELFTDRLGSVTPAISPDGKWIAFAYSELADVPTPKIGLISAEGGPMVKNFGYPIGAGRVHWSPDQKGLQYLLTRSGASNIWEQPLAGGAPHPVTDFTSGHIFDYAWTRDGKQLLLARGEQSSDVVMISNFR